MDPGSKFTNTQRNGNYNSEAIDTSFSLSSFAEDTTPLGESRGIHSGVRKIKEVLNEFEERNNDDKEEWLQFSSNEAEEIRMLGCWVGAKADVKNRKKSEWSLGPSEKLPQRKLAVKETISQDCRSMCGK